jgi:uncharacterized protein (TIGR03790 family)
MHTHRLEHLLRLVILTAVASSAYAGGSPENALLIVDPTNPESLYVANYYRHKRDIPDANVIYMSPTPGSYAQFTASTLDGFRGMLENLRIGDHVDYVLLPSGTNFYMSAPGLIGDQCAAVNRFSATSPYALSFLSSLISGGTLQSMHPNGYSTASDLARAFDSSVAWQGGVPGVNGTHYYIAAMLGYTGSLGNTLSEVLAMIDRSVAVDGTRPSGTFYFMHTNDVARSGPRDPFYPAAVSSIQSFGGSASLLFADLPLGQFDCLGIMTGLADPPIDAANIGLLPGSFCDHLTSYAATFDSASQTKMSRWIAKGASGTSGAVEEPCNYAGKFPHARLHVFYDQGLSLGEAWFRSLAYAPFQTLFTGDPLTRPFAYLPSVTLSGIPPAPASGLIVLVPGATTAHPSAHIASFELLVDGRSLSTATPGHAFPLDTTALADGWHELRVLAYDDTLVKSTGRFIGSVETLNQGRAATIAVSPASGSLTQRFDFTCSASGATVSELRLVQGSRVIASSNSSPAVLGVYGRTLGAGISRIQIEAQFSDGVLARSAPVEIDVAYASGTTSGLAPIAFSYTKHVLNNQSCVVELPATFDDDYSGATTWALLTNPAQAVVQGGGASAYRILKPNAGAAGSDSFTFRANAPAGQSNVATVTLVYDAPATCVSPTTYCTSTPNSSGASAFIASSGSTSIGANDLVLEAYQLPPNKLGIFIFGANATQTPLANGFLCVGAPFQRLGVTQSGLFGDVQQALDFAAPPFSTTPGAVMTGATRRFQLWYRDPAAGGGFSNLTDGLSVTFCQ